MSKASDALQAVGIVNGHDVAKLARSKGMHDVFVMYLPGSDRPGRSPRWQVVRPGYRTDPNAHWQDNYNKTVQVLWRAERQKALDEAIAYAAARYNIQGEWTTVPGLIGYVFPAEVAQMVKQLVRQAAGS